MLAWYRHTCVEIEVLDKGIARLIYLGDDRVSICMNMYYCHGICISHSILGKDVMLRWTGGWI
jgi:hypothetical protein